VGSDHGVGGPLGSEAERQLVRALRSRDEPTFAGLVERYAPAMLRVAGDYVPSREVAEEVVQDTWLALLEGLDGFEERSRLQTWLFRVLINIATTRGARERRCVPFSAYLGRVEGGSPTVDPDVVARHSPPWRSRPSRTASPERCAMSAETLRSVRNALADLPERQRMVVTLRDVIGSTAEEVCATLDITPANQRVLLHRGRAWIRRAVECP
jgi:RNA polymerase sigma-70 factor, ECF subfamily